MLGANGIAAIFEWIEQLLIASLRRNFVRHKDEEKRLGFSWSAWQAEKLKNIERFRRENRSIMSGFTEQIDAETRQLMQEQFAEGVNGAASEAGEPAAPAPGKIFREPQFFGVDSERNRQLIEDICTLESKAETAALRLTDDVYRQTVIRVTLAMSTGSMTLAKAVDTAVQDFLDQGINCIVYKDGRRVNIADYVRMALRTAAARSAIEGKCAGYKALGFDTVAVSAYGMCSKTCEPWQGRVYIDDAFSPWSGETELREGIMWGRSGYCGEWFPLLSSAIGGGLFHPNCRHSVSLWRWGDRPLRRQDNTESERRYKLEQRQRALEREIRKAKRRVAGFTDPENIRQAKRELREAQKKLRDFIEQTNTAEGTTVLKRDYGKETSYGAAELTEAEKNDIIKYEENQKKLREMIANGDVTLTINPDIQNRHYQGTSAYKTFLAKGTEESYFLVPQSELQEILNQRYATGSVRIDRAGVPREIFDCGKELAYDTKLKKYTSFVKVHYSKTKTHLSPYTPNDI